MAFPKLLQKLFQNSGAGSLLRTDIIPPIAYSSITGTPTIDTALSTTSANAVANKAVTAAVNTAGYQVGDLRLYAGSDVPDGWFRCDGSTISNMATNYPLLYAVLGTNVLPNYTGRTVIGSSSDINALVEAGLPDIEGQFYHIAGYTGGYLAMLGYLQFGNLDSDGGAFYAKQFTYSQNLYRPSGTIVTDLPVLVTAFKASKYNSIYGNATTVQSPAVKCSVLIKHD